MRTSGRVHGIPRLLQDSGAGAHRERGSGADRVPAARAQVQPRRQQGKERRGASGTGSTRCSGYGEARRLRPARRRWQSGQRFRPPPDWGSGFEFPAAPTRQAAAAYLPPAVPRRGLAGGLQRLLFLALRRETPFAGGGGGARARSSRPRLDISARRPSAARRARWVRRPRGNPTAAARTHTVRVTIPAGVLEGQLVRLAGQGSPAAGGGAVGDLYLEVHILPHPLYQLDGRDVTLTFPVAPWEAALGAAVNVPTLGGPVAMQIPANSQSARNCGCAAGACPARRRGPVRAAEGRGAERQFAGSTGALRTDARPAQLRSARRFCEVRRWYV